jgi:hypothetical protein
MLLLDGGIMPSAGRKDADQQGMSVHPRLAPATGAGGKQQEKCLPAEELSPEGKTVTDAESIL